MKLKRLLRTWKRRTFKIIHLSIFILIIASLIVKFTVWFYVNYRQGLGDQLAQVAIAYHAALLAGMVLLGLGLGFGVEWLILHRKCIFHDPQPDSLAEWITILWGIEQPPLKPESAVAADESANPIEYQYLNLPTRRGRKPTFTLERWLPIAAKWENRDPMRDAFTLAELISDHLGTNPDGSPIVSEQTYYSLWRARAIEELKRRSKK